MMQVPYDLIIFDWNGTLSTGMVPQDSDIMPLFPGVKEMLADLDNQGIFLGIATMAPKRFLLQQLQAHDIEQHFVAYSCGDQGFAKPHPSVIEHIIQETGVATGRTLMVGDSHSDMLCAHYAGVDRVKIGIAAGDEHVTAELDNVTALLSWLNVKSAS